MSDDPIYVTRPYLPQLNELLPYLESIWESRSLTNCAKFHQELEGELCQHLGVQHISLFANATLALITALQALRISGEVITTPFSFVATSHALMWNGVKPVFVDIEPDTLNINPTLIERAITSRTTAIMPVHCYGQPCNVEAIKKIAENYNLKVVYDAAHAFGVEDESGSVLRHGDLSILSFHATKVFNTFEGGCIVCPDKQTKQHIDHLKNFGFVDETTVIETGINGKMSEFNAALGLVQLKHMHRVISARKQVDTYYREKLQNVPGIMCVDFSRVALNNYSYFPILVQRQYPLTRDALYEKLRAKGIFARRYFYPLISEFPMYRELPSASQENLPIASCVAQQILCLPIYPGLSMDSVNAVVKLLKE
jgi:dTDP-4-amino-4,6-dideoxygalactose transaminase